MLHSMLRAATRKNYYETVMVDSPVAYWGVDGNSKSASGLYNATDGPMAYFDGGLALKYARGRMIYPKITGSVLTLEIWIKHDPSLSGWADAFAESSNNHAMIFQNNSSMKMFVGNATGPGPSGVLAVQQRYWIVHGIIMFT